MKLSPTLALTIRVVPCRYFKEAKQRLSQLQSLILDPRLASPQEIGAVLGAPVPSPQAAPGPAGLGLGLGLTSRIAVPVFFCGYAHVLSCHPVF